MPFGPPAFWPQSKFPLSALCRTWFHYTPCTLPVSSRRIGQVGPRFGLVSCPFTNANFLNFLPALNRGWGRVDRVTVPPRHAQSFMLFPSITSSRHFTSAFSLS